MLRKSLRFHGHNSINLVYRRGQTARGPFFALRFLSNPKRQNYRAAVVVSKKVNKSAFIRNRIRRRLYEALRAQPVSPGSYDLVFTVVSDQVLRLSQPELQKMIATQLAKIKR